MAHGLNCSAAWGIFPDQGSSPCLHWQADSFFFFLICLFIYLFLAVLGLCFCARAFSSCGERGPLFIAVRGPLTIAASLVGSTGSRRASSVVVARGLSCSAACGIFPDQGSNPCPLHWQADSQQLRHQGSPGRRILNHCTTREVPILSFDKCTVVV